MRAQRYIKHCLIFIGLFISMGLSYASDKIVVAYVTSWSKTIPDPTIMTHINYAFGHVNNTFDGVRIDNETRLKNIIALKDKNNQLKIMLSVGGWGSGRFSEMATSEKNRHSFAQSCRQTVDRLGLDGIDIDWEYPTQSSANISSSPDDTRNFTLLIKDLRQALGKNYLLTCATVASAQYINLRECIDDLDFVNMMSYDMASAPKHHSALYPSDISGWMTTSAAVDAHLKAGVPPEKLVMGMPLYGRGTKGYNDQPDTLINVRERWHAQSMVPYYVNGQNEFVLGYENERSIAIKCQYIIDHRLKGGMYWEYGNEHQQKLRDVICNILMKGEAAPYTADYAGKRIRFKALFIYDPNAESAHVAFDKQALQFLHKLSYGEGFVYDTKTECPDNIDSLKSYRLIVMLNYLPHSQSQRQAFETYMRQGGGWIGFHGTGYNDRRTNWPWLNEFLGCGPFLSNNWPPQPALVDVESSDHPITRTLPKSFVVPASEFYQFNPSPRANKDVEILVSISPKMFPFGIKDIVNYGDFPIVWRNKNYRMVYLNIGHGDEGFIDATQNLLFTNAFRWVAFSDEE